jgi:hypothetical protein
MEQEEDDLDLRTPEVLDKYKKAAEIANRKFRFKNIFLFLWT